MKKKQFLKALHKNKIFLTCSFAPSLVLFRYRLLQEFRERGYFVTAAAPDFPEKVQKQLENNGIQTLVAPLSRTGINPLSDFGFLNHIRNALLIERPEIFFAYTVKPVIYGMIGAWLARVPNRYAMITGLGYAFGKNSAKQQLIGIFVRFLYSFALKKAHCVFFQNHDDRNLFVKLGIVKFENTAMVNGSGIDLQQFQFTKLPATPLVFLMVARLLKAKGVVEYLKAAAAASAKINKAKWLLVGPIDEGNPDGITKVELDQMLQGSPVEHIGWTDDVRSYLEDCHIYVLPSYREGLPRSVLEAMAVGRPILTTDVPGCRETVIEGENGVLVPAMHSGALADAMVSMATDQAALYRMGVRSRQIAEEKFDAKHIAEKMADAMGIKEID
ncbi:glycosyltransferase family 4 protein [Verrucomicrobia bacterium]|nr:glycosyltransferase family 4 protein [Verrucomicrobiota bacterium]